MKLALGTVAFGLDYGISNSSGKTPQAEVSRILEYAYHQGIDTLDTAAAYGNSEDVLGTFPGIKKFKIITKAFSTNAQFLNHVDLTSQFERSLERMGVESIYALLLHRPDDLLRSPLRDEIARTLGDLKKQGLVKKVGVSAYSPTELLEITKSFSIDLVQIPGNILDQRFWISGCVTELRKLGIEIHVRSSFLQGLLLMNPNSLPETQIRAQQWVEKIQTEAKLQGTSALKICLSYMKSIDLDKIVVGTNNLIQLQEIIEAYLTAPIMKNAAQFYCNDENIVNPAKWGK